MPRVLHTDQVAVEADEEHDREVASASTAARMLAVAVALLLVSLLIIERSRSAFDDDAESAGAFGSGDVQLTDDDQGRTLFDLPTLVPGAPVEDCIEVTYEGSAVPADVHMGVEAGGPLAGDLRVQVEQGTNASFQDCDGFEAEEVVFDGTLQALAASPPISLFEASRSPSARSYRFTFELDADASSGGVAQAEFLWEADAT